MVNLDDLYKAYFNSPPTFSHVWLGHFEGSKQEFRNLFDLTSFYKDYETAKFKRCAFSDYLNTDAYDDEIVGWNYDDSGIENLVAMCFCSSKSINEITQVASNQGIENPNAIIYYGEHQLKSVDNLEQSFMGLKYLGKFIYD